MLVGFHSATLGRHWESIDQEYIIGLQGNHSTCVKFPEFSVTNYHKVYNIIEQFVAASPSVIEARLGPPDDAINVTSQRALKRVQDGQSISANCRTIAETTYRTYRLLVFSRYGPSAAAN
jgi:hypothetical protein